MKRRILKKQVRQLAQGLSPSLKKYQAASDRVHQDIIFGYQREIELVVFELMRAHLLLDRTWPHRKRWLDGLSEDYEWEVTRPVIQGAGQLYWGHWPEVSREITGMRFTVQFKVCPRHGVEYLFTYGDEDVRRYSSRRRC